MTRILALLSFVLIALTGPAAASSSETLEAAARVFSFLGRAPVHPVVRKIVLVNKEGREAAQISGKWLVIESPLSPCVFGVIDGSESKDGKYHAYYTIDFSKMTRWYETFREEPFNFGFERLEFVSVAPDALLYGDVGKPIVFNYLTKPDVILLLSALDRVQDECPLADVPIN